MHPPVLAWWCCCYPTEPSGSRKQDTSFPHDGTPPLLPHNHGVDDDDGCCGGGSVAGFSHQHSGLFLKSPGLVCWRMSYLFGAGAPRQQRLRQKQCEWERECKYKEERKLKKKRMLLLSIRRGGCCGYTGGRRWSRSRHSASTVGEEEGASARLVVTKVILPGFVSFRTGVLCTDASPRGGGGAGRVGKKTLTFFRRHALQAWILLDRPRAASYARGTSI